MRAASWGDEECIDLLLELGAKFKCYCPDTNAIIDMALTTQQLHIVEKCVQLGWKLEYYDPFQKKVPLSSFAVHEISTYEDFMKLHKLGVIDVSKEGNRCYPEKDTQFLDDAVFHQRSWIVRALLEIDPSLALVKNSRGQLPIHNAVTNKSTEIVQLLCAACPSSIDVCDIFGAAPIHHAAFSQMNTHIRLLHAAGSDVYHLKVKRLRNPFKNPVFRIYAHARSLTEILYLSLQ